MKITEEVTRKRIEQIVYASFFCGFIARAVEQRSADNPDNFKEIKNLIELISKNEI